MKSRARWPHRAAAAPAARIAAWRWECLLAAGMLGALAYLIARHAGLQPFVFGDELTYSSQSRQLPIADASVPSYLYLWLARGSSACGAAFLDCVRVGNALLFTASAPLVYLAGRRVCGKPAAAAIAVLSLLAPANTYTAYFMPEASYYFGFWLLAWASLSLPQERWLRYGWVTGAVLGALSLVKVHALFLLPAQCLFVALCAWLDGGRWAGRALRLAALTAAVMLALRFALGYAMAGEAGLKLFGAFYGAYAEASPTDLGKLLPDALANLRGHLLGLALIAAFPLAVIARALPTLRRAAGASNPANRLRLYAMTMLAAPLAMTVMYTASTYAIEGARLHLRYYDFVFPLLWLAGAAAAGGADGQAKQGGWTAWLPAAAAGGAMLYAAGHLAGAFRLLPVDGPELATLMHARPGLQAWAALQAALLALSIARPRLAAMLFVCAQLPLFVALTDAGARAHLATMAQPSMYDLAGKFARATLAQDEREQLSIVGDGGANLMRAKFHADAAGVKLIDLPASTALDAGRLPASGRWLLAVGPRTLPPGASVVAESPHYRLARLDANARRLWQADLTTAMPDLRQVDALEGLGTAEQWGRWSTGKTVTVRFRRPLPRRLALTLHARAFGPNAGQPFLLRAGAAQAVFTPGAAPADIHLRLSTDGLQKSIIITVPRPVSPRQLGMSTDARLLGIGLSAIDVAEANGNQEESPTP